MNETFIDGLLGDLNPHYADGTHNPFNNSVRNALQDAELCNHIKDFKSAQEIYGLVRRYVGALIKDSELLGRELVPIESPANCSGIDHLREICGEPAKK